MIQVALPVACLVATVVCAAVERPAWRAAATGLWASVVALQLEFALRWARRAIANQLDRST
ncbi:MAG: hypothetical protein LBT54_02565 [Bifidobacteriaceae bacterium]|nr:hypothetical protein [Bifidobacteriaceae bacterium]